MTPRLTNAWRELDLVLRRILLVDLLCLVGAIKALAISIALGFDFQEAALDLAALVIATAVLVAGCLTIVWWAEQGVVVGLTVSTLCFSLIATWETPMLVPATVLLVFFPVLVGFPYLHRRLVVPFLAYSVIGTAALAALAEWRRPSAHPDTWVIAAVVVACTLPFVTVVVAYAVIANYNRMRDQAVALRDSRTAIVEVAHAARRGLERDLHDGAQQRLVAMSVEIGRARQAIAAGEVDEADRLLAQLGQDTTAALSELRELVRGIYPPLLSERGLAAAVRSAASRSTVPVTVDEGDVGRHASEVEAAAYFCVLEALQNVAKHADARAVRVTLTADHELECSVVDDGRGFDPDQVEHGGGLLGLHARVAAVGGRLHVRSARGQGTEVVVTFAPGTRLPTEPGRP